MRALKLSYGCLCVNGMSTLVVSPSFGVGRFVESFEGIDMAHYHIRGAVAPGHLALDYQELSLRSVNVPLVHPREDHQGNMASLVLRSDERCF